MPLNDESFTEGAYSRAGDWLGRMFNYEVYGGTPTVFEAEAQTIIADLILCKPIPAKEEPHATL